MFTCIGAFPLAGASDWCVLPKPALLHESVLLCAIGGSFGTGLALLSLAFGGLAIGAEGVAIGFRSLAFLAATGFAMSVLVGCAAGLIPAWQAARTDIVRALREN
jgi:putative ABC transport system permease protein